MTPPDFEKTAKRLAFTLGCNWTGAGDGIHAALIEAFNLGLETAAVAADAESARVLACQTKPRTDFDDSVNLNLRMTTVLLPNLAQDVRAKKLTREDR